jgi:DNA-directed RNA polymerase I subunit RPA2
MNPEELVSHREEANEVGGYFIVNGNEKVVRLLIMMKKNDVITNSS